MQRLETDVDDDINQSRQLTRTDDDGVRRDEDDVDGYSLLWNPHAADFSSPLHPKQRTIRLIRILAFCAYAFFLFIGIALVGTGGFAVGTGIGELMPKHFPAFGIFIVGVSFILCSGIGAFACFRKNRILLIITSILFVILILAQLGLGIMGALMGKGQWQSELAQSWSTTPLPAREIVENAFNCCGYHSYSDEFPPGWDETCPANVTKQICCALNSIYITEGWNASIAKGSCSEGQSRLECCGSPDPCAVHKPELEPCEDALLEFFSDQIGIIAAVATVFGLFELLGLVVTIILTWKLWSPLITSPSRYSRL